MIMPDVVGQYPTFGGLSTVLECRRNSDSTLTHEPGRSSVEECRDEISRQLISVSFLNPKSSSHACRALLTTEG
jgi:hypothetical protein